MIELTVAISVSGVLMVLLASLLAVMMKADRGTREALAEDQTLEQLAAQFRGDVKRAEEATVREGDALELVLGKGHRVTYARIDGRLRREESKAEERIAHEEYRALPLEAVRVGVGPREATGVRFVRLELQRRPVRPEGPVTSLELVAPLGRLHRFAPAEGKDSP